MANPLVIDAPDAATQSAPGSAPALPTARRGWLGVVGALVELGKPGITRMVLITAGCGALVAPGAVDLPLLLVAVLGTGLTVGAANGLNMVLERDIDVHMRRTAKRPLPTGRLSPHLATVVSIAAGISGMALLALAVNPLTALLAAIALLTYVLAYTPLKQVTSWAAQVGAVPGALPPVIGWAAMTGSIGPEALALFAILYVWQIPHFHAIAVFRQEEYERAGIRIMPTDSGLAATRRSIVAHQVLLLLVSLTPALVGMAGVVYLQVAAALGFAFLASGLAGLWDASEDPVVVRRWARLVFFASLPYLVLLYGALVFLAS